MTGSVTIVHGKAGNVKATEYNFPLTNRKRSTSTTVSQHLKHDKTVSALTAGCRAIVTANANYYGYSTLALLFP